MKEERRIPRVMFAAVSSNSGKTLITCGVLAAFMKRGMRALSFKCGPDYIDPMFHKTVIGVPARNLDTFFTEPDLTRMLFSHGAEKGEISVIEGVMGYYDGIGGTLTKASSYELANVIDTPVVLIVNGKGMSLSLLAVIKGFLEFQPNSHIKAVLLNRVSETIYHKIKLKIEKDLGILVLGYIPELKDLPFKSRHLGLVLPEEIKGIKDKINALAEQLEKTIDMKGLIQLAYEAKPLELELDTHERIYKKMKPGKTVRIGIARDEAFSFYYEENLELLRASGAKLIAFSPLSDKSLPENLDGILLGGGYPELYAKELSANSSMLDSIRNEVKNGIPCIAECGGFMYLHDYLESHDGQMLPMVKLISGKAFRSDHLARFGYIQLTAKRDHILYKKGEQIKAHEFHYWDSENPGKEFHAQKPMSDRGWDCMIATENLIAGYPHLYYLSNPEFPARWVEYCRSCKEKNDDTTNKPHSEA